MKNYGLEDEKIASSPSLLGLHPETIRAHYQSLLELGIDPEKIASYPQLLTRNPETIKRSYQHHVGLLRKDYRDRESGRDLLLNQPSLLNISPETIEANVQFLYELGIDYYNSPLLKTTPELKHKKMAWMLRELFDYNILNEDQKRDAIYSLYEFLRDNPSVLIKSIKYMEKSKEKLREKASRYRRF